MLSKILRRGMPLAAVALSGLVATAMVLLISLDGGSLRSETASAAAGGPEMALKITEGGFCAGSDCYAAVGQDFKLGVDFVGVPAGGYGIMQTFIDIGGLAYVPTAGAAGEIKWPDGAVKLRGTHWTNAVYHGSVGFPASSMSQFEGIAVEFTLTCDLTPSSTTVSLVLDGPVPGTFGSKFGYVTAAHATVEIVPKVNSVTLNCIAADTDTDGDGCSDLKENGTDPNLGGDRDWLNPWDFYDVAIAGGVPGTDGVIDLPNDQFGVSAHYAPLGGPPYDVHYDRGPAAGPSWNGTTGPDGVIDLPNDILGVVQQLGHNCT